jgi:hypothetical protein
MSGGIPGIETIVGAALGVNGGQGHSSALRDYGADGLFALVKTSIGLPTTNDEIRKIAERAFKIDAGWTSDLDNDKISPIVLPSYMDEELKDCIACNFEYEKVPVQRCEPNMNYNYLTGKCERLMFNGFTPSDCYNPCADIVAFSGELPKGVIECDGAYYYDTKNCGSSGIFDIFDNDKTIGQSVAAAAGAIGIGLLTGFLADSSRRTVNYPLFAGESVKNI